MTSSTRTEAILERFEEGRARFPGSSEARAGALAAFAETGFPTLRDEAWKYTSLERLARTDFDPFADPVEIDLPELEPFLLPGAHRVTVVNGHADVSDVGALPDGASVEPLSTAVGEAAGFGPGGASETPLAALNAAFTRDGIVLRVDDGVALERPVQVLHVACGAGPAIALHTRNVVCVGAGARVTVVETFVGFGSARSWTNAVTELRLARGARAVHVKLQAEAPPAYHTALVAARLAADSACSSTVLGTGAALSRNDARIVLEGAGAACDLRGGLLLRGRQHGDNTVRVAHRAERATSGQVFRNVLDDRARAVFQGGVEVCAGAAGTESAQSGRSLLLSPGTRADSKPELRILADDVKCTHGATVGELDRDALFYLASRGVPPDRARALLVRAFVAEALEGAPEGAVRNHLEGAVSRWMEGFAP